MGWRVCDDAQVGSGVPFSSLFPEIVQFRITPFHGTWPPEPTVSMGFVLVNYLLRPGQTKPAVRGTIRQKDLREVWHGTTLRDLRRKDIRLCTYMSGKSEFRKCDTVRRRMARPLGFCAPALRPTGDCHRPFRGRSDSGSVPRQDVRLDMVRLTG